MLLLPVPAGYLVTARQAISMPIVCLGRRVSPRSSNSITEPARPRTFSALAPWVHFPRAMEELEARLDNKDARCTPLLVPGDASLGSSWDAAADENEVRAPWPSSSTTWRSTMAFCTSC